MILLLTLIGSINALDMDVPIDELDAMPDDQLQETSIQTNHLTAAINAHKTKPVTVLVNCMLYWIQL